MNNVFHKVIYFTVISDVAYGSFLTYTFTPAEGYHLTSVKIDGVALSEEEVEQIAIIGYTFTNVLADHTISATFSIKKYK